MASLPIGKSVSKPIQKFQDAQDSANSANSRRYKQGLNVLQGGVGKSSGLLKKGTGVINEAIQGTKNLGRKELRDIGEANQQGHASTQQSAINRGLGNTTITDALHRGVDRDSRDARLNVLDKVAAARSGLLVTKANQLGSRAGQAQSGAGDIASYIASRNDVSPSISELAPLIQGAASDPGNTKRTGTVTAGSGGSFSSGGGGSLGAGGTIQGGGIGLLGSGRGGSAEVFYGNGGPIQNAIQPTAPTAPTAPVMPPATPTPTTPGSISITPHKPKPTNWLTSGLWALPGGN